jgi:Protein of unknown function (DUF559)
MRGSTHAPTPATLAAMSEPRPKRCAERNGSPAVRLAALANRQEGVVKERQLRELGLDRFAVRRWVAAGRLHRRYPGVYSVGHDVLTATGQRPRRLERVLHHRLPVTPVARTLLDFAAHASHNDVRKALAQADFRGLLRLQELESVTGRGLPGSANLRAALETHLPQLAETNGPLEERFLFLCESEGIELPIPNQWVGPYKVDALWPVERVIVELDGKSAHGSDARRLIDHERDMKLRSLGYVVRRYSWHQVLFKPARVSADLKRTLAARRTTSSEELR